MHMRKLLLLLFGIIFSTINVSAQRTLTGKVTDENGNPVAGASVTVKDMKGGVSTNANGQFTLSVKDNAQTLVITYVGMLPVEMAITSQKSYEISLKSSGKILDDVIVSTGYEKKNKRDIAGAVGSVKAKDIENLPVQSFERAIQGKISGVQVTAVNGIPGGAIDVKIRGVGSINAGNAPLYIVDGIQMNSGDQTRNFPSSNAMASINPDDIASIDVLKDPASASIYGAQAANGVVVITTKRGKAGKTKVTYNTYLGVTRELKRLEVLTTPQLIQLGYEAYLYRDGLAAANNFLSSFGVPDVKTLPTYDWQDAVFREGFIQNHELSMSGGNDRTTFLTSFSLNKFKGQVINTDFERETFRINLDHKVSNKVGIGMSLGASRFKQNGVNGGGAFSNPNRNGILQWPGNAPFNPDGSVNMNDGPGVYFGTYFENPVKEATINTTNAINKKMQANFFASYQILPGLLFKSSVNLDYTDIKENTFVDPRSTDGTKTGDAGYLATEITDIQTDQTLSYKLNFHEKHNLSFLGGFQYRKDIRTGYSAFGSGVPIYLLQSLGATSQPTGVSSFYTDWKLAGMFLKADYIYDNRFILGATIRRDGSSRFGKNTRWGYFPAGQVAWRINNENFMRDSRVFNELKLRLSYGITGNSNIGNYDAKSTLGLSGDYDSQTGLTVARLNIDNLSWEENHGFNAGIDFGLFKNRISGTVDIFNSNRKKLLLDKPLPGTSGFATVRQNVGVLNSKGIEVSLSTVNLQWKGLKWTTDISFTKLKNSVTSLLEGQTQIGTATKVGLPLNSIFTQIYAGVNPADGRPFFLDTLGNLTYIPVARDRRYLPRTFDPTWFGGVTNTVSYKGFELKVFFQFSGGNYLLNQDAIFASRSGSTIDRNQYASQLRRWQKPGDVTDVPRPYRGGTQPGASSNYLLSSRFYENGDYLRLKEFTVAYNLPSTITSRFHIQAARFYISGLNVATWSNYLGYDPELVNGATGDFGVYPQGRQMNGGIQITF